MNNAGIAFKGSRFDEEVVRTTFNCNVFGTWNFTDSMLPYVKDGGHIINVTSMAGRCHNLPSQQIKDRILNPNLTRD